MKLRAGALLLLVGVAQAKTFYLGWLDKWGGCLKDCGDVVHHDGQYGRTNSMRWVCLAGMTTERGLMSCYDGGRQGTEISQVRDAFQSAWNNWLDGWKSLDDFWRAEPWLYTMPDEDVYQYPSDSSHGPSTHMPNPLTDGRGFKSLGLGGTPTDHDIVVFRSDTQGTLSGTVSAALPLLDPSIPSVNKMEKCTLRNTKCVQNAAPRKRACEFICEDWTGKEIPRQVDIMIGPGKADYTREVGAIIGFYKVPHMQHGTNNRDAGLSDKNEYPLYLRATSSYQQGGKQIVNLMSQMNWNRAGMLYTTDRNGQSFAAEVAKYAHAADVHISAFGVATGTRPTSALKMLKEEGVRIIIMAANQDEVFHFKEAQYDAGMMKGRMGPGKEDFTYIYPMTRNMRNHFESSDITILTNLEMANVPHYEKFIEEGGKALCEGYKNGGRIGQNKFAANIWCRMMKCIDDPTWPCEFWDAKKMTPAHNEYAKMFYSTNAGAGDLYMYNMKNKSPKVAQVLNYEYHSRYALVSFLLAQDAFEAGFQMAYMSINGLRMLAEIEEICTHTVEADLRTFLNTYSSGANDYNPTSKTNTWTLKQLRDKIIEEYYKENNIDPSFDEDARFGFPDFTDSVLDQTTLCDRFNYNSTTMTKSSGPFADPMGTNKLVVYNDARHHGHTGKAGTKVDFKGRGQILYSLMRDTWIDQLHDKDRLLQTGEMAAQYEIRALRGTNTDPVRYMEPGTGLLSGGTHETKFTGKCIYGRMPYKLPISGVIKRAGLKAPAGPKCDANGQMTVGYAGLTPYVTNTKPTGGVTRRKNGVSWRLTPLYEKITPENCIGCYWGLFRGEGPVPLAKPLVVRQQRRVSDVAKHVFQKLSLCGILVAAFLLGFNYKLRNRRYIRMSSPNINSIIIVGIVLVLIALFPMSFDTHDDIAQYTEEEKDAMMAGWCQQRVGFLCFGFTLAFEALFAKTYRVHKIFNAKLLGNVKVTDFELFQIIGVFSVVDAILITCWFLTDPLHRQVTDFPTYVNPLNNDEVILEWYETCHSNYMAEWVGAMYAYKGITLACGAWLAFQTRNVEIPALNDSKWIGFAIYNVTIICVTMLPVLPFLSYHPNVWFCYAGSGVLILAVGVLGLIFFPKVYTVLMNEDEAATQSQMTRLQSSKMKRTTKWSSKASSKMSKYSAKSSMAQSEMDTA